MAANPVKSTDIAAKGVADNLIKGLKDSKTGVDDLNKSLIALGKTQKKNAEQLKKQPDTIKKAKEVNKSAKKADDTAKAINKTREETLKLDKKLLAANNALLVSESKEAKQIAELNLKKTKQNQLNKEAAVLGQKTVGTLERISVQNKKLIRERSKLNLDTAKGAKRLKEINLELDKNNKRVKENVSNLEKQKIGIGGYSDGIKEAAGASGLFGGVLGKLAAIQGTINALTKKNLVASKADAAVKNRQAAATAKLSIAQRASAVATGIGTKAMKIFKFALASTGIGLLVVALGAMVAFFTRSQKGIDFLAVKMAQLGAVTDVIIDAFAAFGEAIFDVFSKPQAIIDSLITFIKSIPELVLDNIINRFLAFGVILDAIIEGNLKGIADGFLQLGTGVEDFSDKAVAAIEAVGEASEAAVKKAEELAKVMAEKARIAGILKDLTIDLAREEALFSAAQATTITKIKELNLISRDKLKSDEERIKALKEANELELSLADDQLALAKKSLAASLDGLSVDEKSLKNDEARLEFIEAIKDGTISTADAIQQAADFTLSSAKGEEALLEVIEKIKAIEQERQNIKGLEATTIKKLSALYVQQATKQGMALTREATAKRQLAKNDELSVERRTELLKEAAIAEVNAFRVQTKVHVKNEEELAAARIQIKAKFLADVKKLEDDDEAKRLAIENKRLSTLEDIRQEELDGQIAHQERLLDNEKLTVSERIEIIEEIFRLRKEAIEKTAEFELKSDTLTKEERELIKLAEVNALNALEHEKVTAVEDANAAILDSDEDTGKKRIEEAKKIAQNIVKEFQSELAQINKAKIDALNNDVSEPKDSVKEQQRIAAAGGEAIVGEEKARLAKLRLERKRELEEQALLERRVALAQNFVNALASYSKEDPETAFAKAAVETFAGAGFAKIIAGFAEGGYTGDGGKHDVAGLVHKGENVNTAEQVNKYGMKNWSARDFDKKVEAGHFNQYSDLDLSPSHFKQLEVSKMVQPNNVNLMPLIMEQKQGIATLKKTIEDNRPIYNSGLNKSNEWFEEEYIRMVRKRTTNKRPRL